MKHSEEKLYTINQVASLCSISRASLIRMEEDGILQPTYRNPETGYRYYNSENVAKIIHNLSMQKLGLTHKEIKCYTPSGGFDEFLEILEGKRRHLEDLMTEIRARLTDKDVFKVEHTRTSEHVYYTRMLRNVRYTSVVPLFLKETFGEALNRNFRIEWRLPNSIMMDASDFLKGDFLSGPHDYTVCIPVLPSRQNSHDTHLLTLPACSAVQILFSGDASNIPRAFVRLGEYLRINGIEPCGPARFMGIINEFPRYDNPEINHAARILIPIRENEAAT